MLGVLLCWVAVGVRCTAAIKRTDLLVFIKKSVFNFGIN